MGAGGAAGDARHAGAVCGGHLPAGLRRHCRLHRRDAGADAADAVGVPVRLCLHEPVPRRAVRQLRPAAGGARRHRAVHPRLGRLRDERQHRRAGVLARAAGPVDRRRHRRVARGDPRHVPARRCAARDVAGDDLLRRRAGRRTDRRRLAVRARELARDLLVSRRGGRRAVDRQLEAAARNVARHAAPAVQRAQPDARLLAAGLEFAFRGTGLRQRRAVQRHVPVRAVGADVPGQAPRPRADRVLSSS